MQHVLISNSVPLLKDLLAIIIAVMSTKGMTPRLMLLPSQCIGLPADADSKAVDGVSDGVPSLWGRVPGSRKFRSKFGQQAITGVRQSKTAA